LKRFLLLIICSFAYSAILHVPSEYSTIQEAINNHIQGDTVLVAPGTYEISDNISIQSSNLSIISSEGSEQTFINATNINSVNHTFLVYDSDIFIKGFTIGQSNNERILIDNSISHLEDIKFTDELGYIDKDNIRGEFIYLNNSKDATMKNIYVENLVLEFASYNDIVEGALFYIDSESNYYITLENICIENNSIDILGGYPGSNSFTEDIRGGLINTTGSNSINMKQLKIINNYIGLSGDWMYGGLVRSTHNTFLDQSIIAQNVIRYNQEGYNGIYIEGGMFHWHGTATLTNNTIVNNTQLVEGYINWSNCAFSGSISYHNTTSSVFNNIIDNNISTEGGSWNNGAGIEALYTGYTYTIFQNNMIQNGIIQINYDFVNSNLVYDDSNLDYDPQFIDYDNGDYNLQSTSPCIDAGNLNLPLDPDGTNSDIGAFYYHQGNALSGCMDESACNYEPLATHEDNSCEYTSCLGCMDESAQNYDESVTQDDGSCIYHPTIISIYDVPEDQGGYVFVNWQANSLDVLPNEDITHYSVLRYVPNERGWELLSEIPALYEDDYTYLAPTIQISIPSEDVYYYTDYKVRAHTAEQSVFYDSEVVSGYSADNLAPLVSSNFSGIHNDEQMQFTWYYESENDFSHHVFNSLNHDEIVTQDTLITLNMNSSYDEHYVANIDIHYNQSNSDHSSVHNLHYGANLISLSVLADNLDIGTMLESLESNVNSIIGEGQAATLNPNLGWIGSLSNISPTDGYWLKVDSEDMLIISGERTYCEELSYDIHEGANLISYCCEQPISLENIPEGCYSIIGEGNASTYNPALGWIGSLSQLSPGKGYWLTCNQSLQFNWDCSN
tara:strand:+ start:1330 stop:3858 length:2529 start_codon:yes stop_codon:yes gene_type:complete